MQAAKLRSRISEFSCSVWPTNTGLPEKWGRISAGSNSAAQLIVGLQVHRHVGQIIGVREDEIVGLVVVAATVEQLPVLAGNVLDSSRKNTSPVSRCRRNSPNSGAPPRCRGPRTSFPRGCRESAPPGTPREAQAGDRARRGCHGPDRRHRRGTPVDRSGGDRSPRERVERMHTPVNVADRDQTRAIGMHESSNGLIFASQGRRSHSMHPPLANASRSPDGDVPSEAAGPTAA